MTSSSGPIRNGIFLIQNVETNTFLKLSSNNRIESRPMRSGTTSPSTRMLWLVDERFDGYVTIRNAARNESYASIQYDIEGFNARIVFSQVPCSWAIAEATFSQYIIRTGNSMSSLSMYWELLDDAPGTVVTLEESQIQGFRWKFYSQRRTPTVAPPALPYSIQNIFNPSRLRTRPPRPGMYRFCACRTLPLIPCVDMNI
ncbi:hypothetical protein BD410DRAFT_547760 [Rickenella mellea]|uniref:Ricin B lectin domain-containing protein n=1 Tax=Rickenella mellea TaxID=50990 RepID=A0A4Y7PR17_9AGAM|nr:hypothetical protein BD410DRAFT_547760 [Rickenella mellea]